MDEDLFVFYGSGVKYVGKRNVEPYDRDPDKLWLGRSQLYLDLPSFTLVDEREGLQTLYTVDPSVLLYTSLVTFGEKTPDGRLLKGPTAAWFEIGNRLAQDPAFRF